MTDIVLAILLNIGIFVILAFFPRLRERTRQLGATLSGGERRMIC